MKFPALRFWLVVLLNAVLVVGVGSAAGQSGPKKLMRTYDVRIVGSVTTMAPDIVFVEKATHVYKRVRVVVIDSNGRVSVGPADINKAPDVPPNGVMSGGVTFVQTGSAPCSQSKRFRGAARVDVSGAGGRAVGAYGGWAGVAGGAGLTPKEWKCPGLVHVDGAADFPWEYAKGLVIAEFSSYGGGLAWLLRPSRGRLPFPMDRLYAGKSFAGNASGSASVGPLRKKGTLSVTLTARR